MVSIAAKNKRKSKELCTKVKIKGKCVEYKYAEKRIPNNRLQNKVT